MLQVEEHDRKFANADDRTLEMEPIFQSLKLGCWNRKPPSSRAEHEHSGPAR
jgi:hypothetical protein